MAILDLTIYESGDGGDLDLLNDDLNTIEGDSEIVSLSTNQFTLGAGSYDMDAIAPCRGTQNSHKARLYNITDSSIVSIGTNARNGGADDHEAAFVSAKVTITSSTTFELQHYAAATRSTDGFGVELSNIFCL